ncbi:DNA-formamidopyrimidine glycosylase [Prochlorococcus sp. MIT 1223]|uniref:DNA-formamidopyrimidine glycosylase n=1 Tax=Prochlorococcus sp. MIT 1223 TaxID=3096217 RepID=UPI002A748A2B|nr:DNA-formamidopyrimidine glycosylase [Prochlorococcus sp. MIT 1223]
MPELPEVETVRLGLERKLTDFIIKEVEVLSERTIASNGGGKEFISNMKGLKVSLWRRRGKYLIASMKNLNIKSVAKNNAGWWATHLRMTGQFQFHTESCSPCSHTRVRFWDKENKELRFVDTRNFAQMWWIKPSSSPFHSINGLKTIGPEPFSKDFNAIYLKEQFKGRKRSIKSILLDQRIVAGVGNIYADESLFAANILPTRESGELTIHELEKLCKSLVKILKISIGEGGTTFSDFRDLEGVNGNYGGQAWVYRRGNKPCRKCGEKIIRKKIAGRGTHWCSNCQI